MPSRKKAKGKARKAAKEAKAKEEESQAVVEVAANQRQEESVEARIQRLMINATPPKLCMHGRDAVSPGDREICDDFINAFMAVCHSQNGDVTRAFDTALHATWEQYVDVYYSKLDTAISLLSAEGTHCILDGDNRKAQVYATYASYFEELMAVNVHKTKATASWTKPVELLRADDHTLVSYYRKRIPCACLDQRYKEVKSLAKMGVCYNENCSKPNRQVERSKMFCCTRCGEANYCSVECQKADWRRHKQCCDEDAKLKPAFDAQM